MRDDDVKNSLAYRKNEKEILRGNVPKKYTRIAPFVKGPRVLEFGSAEGVLSLLLAREGKSVISLERRADRHESALKLSEAWRAQCLVTAAPNFVNAGISERLDLLEGVDTVLAVRVIYYLLDQIDPVFAAISEKVSQVVLCGNKNRAGWWREGLLGPNDRADNYYASAEGMRDLLTRHGYEIEAEVLDGDEIVVGRRR
jgi:predicted nicotinamide N-methyase